MSGMSEEWQRQKDEANRIIFERADAAYYALPDAMHENLEIGRAVHNSQQDLLQQNIVLRKEVTALQAKISELSSPGARWKERSIGLLLGVIASVIASIFWWQAGLRWAILH
ncbi:hypothetical protein [Aquabacterium sp.]|uniref:hypothetical protein n=1 Tax=Aquabacterium sp. TaxID=1872578 RepID=UPI00248841FA|nr:hypothetical protein [Aquabacterium sp.]MDI1260195.1 hypothetical protein [Aquabacterium sp.]